MGISKDRDQLEDLARIAFIMPIAALTIRNTWTVTSPLTASKSAWHSQ
jgi:hypothetical protein